LRSNPTYQNICWYRFGRYQYNKCDECSKKEECDDTQQWWNISGSILSQGSKTPRGKHVKSKKKYR